MNPKTSLLKKDYNTEKQKELYTPFFLRTPNFFPSFNNPNFSGSEPKIILNLCLSVKGVAWSGNERNVFKSLLMS